jgi:hypothetical protein
MRPNTPPPIFPSSYSRFMRSQTEGWLVMQATSDTPSLRTPRDLRQVCGRLDLPALQFRLLVPTRPRPCSTPLHQPYPPCLTQPPRPHNHRCALLSRFRKSSHIAFMLCYFPCNRRCRSKFQHLGGASRTRYPPRGPSSSGPIPFPSRDQGSTVRYDWDAAYKGYRPILKLPVLYYLCCYCIALEPFPAR